MNQIIVDATLTEKLAGLSESVQLCDEHGRVLGDFWPVVDPSMYKGVDAPASAEELDRRSKEPGGLTTLEVLRRLHDLKEAEDFR
jgi:hypothetical protein